MDNQNVKTHHDHLQPLLKINSADREKYRRLNEQRWGWGKGEGELPVPTPEGLWSSPHASRPFPLCTLLPVCPGVRGLTKLPSYTDG